MIGELAQQLIGYLVEDMNGNGKEVKFFKSKDLAKISGMKPKAIGAILGNLKKNSPIQLEYDGTRCHLSIEGWSYSKSTTWKVQIKILDPPEPAAD